MDTDNKLILYNKIKIENKNLIFIILSLYIELYILRVFSGTFKLLDTKYFIVNILILYSIFMILFFVFKKVKFTLILLNIFTLLFGIFNYVLIDITGSPFSFFNLYLWRSALNSIEKFSVYFSSYFYFSILIFFINIIFIVFFIKEDRWLGKIDKTIFLISGLLIISIIWFFATPKLYYITNKSDNKYGTLYRFLKTTKNVSLEKPEGYSIEKVQDILKKYDINDNELNNNIDNEKEQTNITEESDKPNIIVIMNESLSDINSVYKMGYDKNLEFINSLSNGTKLYSSVFGNRTANSEFEFLTGFSTVFYSEDVLPYQKYIKSNKYSFVQLMKDNGYKTIVYHPYLSSSYNRKYVYNYFGFDNIELNNELNSITLAKICNSDMNIYNDIINKFENKSKNEKIFDFTITLQNHTPFTENFEKLKNDYPEYINKIQEFEDLYEDKYNIEDNAKLATYLNYQNMSDNAFKKLTEYFKNYDEKVIILLFGDHQPKIKTLYNNEIKNYLVSYSLWTNYDVEKEEIEKTSINYLSTVLTKMIGLENSKQFKFIYELRKKIPVITRTKYLGDDGKWYKISNKKSPYYELILEYKYLQYYYMTSDSGM